MIVKRLFLFILTFAVIARGEDTKLKPRDENFFPLAVWLQDPRNVDRFKAAGINTYVGLWKGPTEDQLSRLKAAGMKILCAQNAVGLAHKDDPAIIAWMQEDEPDNAQSLGARLGYAAPILPEKVIALYQKMRAADPTRPILLNLGQGVARDEYIGRGSRRNHPEDYSEYVKGGDIVAFDVYPATHNEKAARGKLELVALGVQRLKNWAGPNREVWNCVEAKLAEDNMRVTPRDLRAEVWMSLINGTQGIIYFVHQFKPTFREASVFDDADLLKAFTEVNHRIAELAPVLNAPKIQGLHVTTRQGSGPVAAMAKQRGDDVYIFAVGMSGESAGATIALPKTDTKYEVEVVGEGRAFHNTDGAFADQFNAYQTHLYNLTPVK